MLVTLLTIFFVFRWFFLLLLYFHCIYLNVNLLIFIRISMLLLFFFFCVHHRRCHCYSHICSFYAFTIIMIALIMVLDTRFEWHERMKKKMQKKKIVMKLKLSCWMFLSLFRFHSTLFSSVCSSKCLLLPPHLNS